MDLKTNFGDLFPFHLIQMNPDQKMNWKQNNDVMRFFNRAFTMSQ